MKLTRGTRPIRSGILVVFEAVFTQEVREMLRGSGWEMFPFLISRNKVQIVHVSHFFTSGNFPFT